MKLQVHLVKVCQHRPDEELCALGVSLAALAWWFQHHVPVVGDVVLKDVDFQPHWLDLAPETTRN